MISSFLPIVGYNVLAEEGRLGYSTAVVVRTLAADQVGNSCALAKSVSESLFMKMVLTI